MEINYTGDMIKDYDFIPKYVLLNASYGGKLGLWDNSLAEGISPH